jgi:serine/threonine protein kinase
MIQKISEGSYGYIFSDGVYVYKIGKSKEWDCSMIRETYLLSFFKDSPFVVNFYGSIDRDTAEKTFGFLVKEKLVDRVMGIVLEKMDCNLKEFCNYLAETYCNNSEQLSMLYKKIFEKCLLALYELQKYYILHNDLKLINILVSYRRNAASEFSLKLCDFGLGIQTSSFGMDEILCLGTCKYSAPEMRHKSVTKFYKKKPEYPQTLAMDIYSMGVILVHVLCILIGKKPLEKVTLETFQGLLQRNKDGERFFSVEGFEFLSAEGVAVLESMLQEDPETRENPRSCLKADFFNQRINRFKFVENMKVILKSHTYGCDRELYARFEQKMKEWSFDILPFEIYTNVFHCMMQARYLLETKYNAARSDRSDSTVSLQELPFLSLFKVCLGWVLSIYHHRESQRYRKMVSNSSEKLKFRKLEYEYRPLMNDIVIVPFMSMFKACEINNEVNRQKIFNYIFS